MSKIIVASSSNFQQGKSANHIAGAFFQSTVFPYVMGLIDRTHVKIYKPISKEC